MDRHTQNDPLALYTRASPFCLSLHPHLTGVSDFLPRRGREVESALADQVMSPGASSFKFAVDCPLWAENPAETGESVLSLMS
jgi:hypothetical protein